MGDKRCYRVTEGVIRGQRCIKCGYGDALKGDKNMYS